MKKSEVKSSLLTGNKRKAISESEAIQNALKKAGTKGSSQQHEEIIKDAVNKYRSSQKIPVDTEIIVEKEIIYEGKCCLS